MVSKQFSSLGFEDLSEEIIFFKQTKPLFTAHIEYYKFLYHFQLFQPDYCSKKMKAFIKEEMNRLKKFRLAHQTFCSYYKSGATDLDHSYFTQLAAADACLLSKSYNINPRLISSHDHLASALLALEKYTDWLQQLGTKKHTSVH